VARLSLGGRRWVDVAGADGLRLVHAADLRADSQAIARNTWAKEQRN
jgi:hypothetical protein